MPSGIAYIDTSLLIRMRFEDAGRREAKRIEKYDRLFAGDLLIAETFAFAKREKLALESVLEATKGISWIIPDRSLAGEIKSQSWDICEGPIRGTSPVRVILPRIR